MRDIIDKKQKLTNYATRLKSIIYLIETKHNKEFTDKLFKEKEELERKINFLNNYLEEYRKERRR